MTHEHLDEQFFIESDEPLSAARSLEDTVKMLVHNWQETTIACEFSRLASEECLRDIMAHMRHMEEETLPNVEAIDEQSQIKWEMRPHLINFLIEVHAGFALLPETLFLAVKETKRTKRPWFRRKREVPIEIRTGAFIQDDTS